MKSKPDYDFFEKSLCNVRKLRGIITMSCWDRRKSEMMHPVLLRQESYRERMNLETAFSRQLVMLQYPGMG